MKLFRELIERIGNALRAPFQSIARDARRASFPEHYVRTLEEEVARLRADNRALLNSLLGTAGIPPLEIPGGAATRPAAMPTRRRSWPQIAQSLEAQSRDATTSRNAMQARVNSKKETLSS
jgi:hypothetical protein